MALPPCVAPGEALHPEREPFEVLERAAARARFRHFRGPVSAISGAAGRRHDPAGVAALLRQGSRNGPIGPRSSRAGTPPPRTGPKTTGQFARPGCCTTRSTTSSIVVRGRFDYPRLKATAIAQAERHKPRRCPDRGRLHRDGACPGAQASAQVSCPARPDRTR